MEKSSVFKEFSHRKIPVRHAGRDRLEIYFGKPEFTMSFELYFFLIGVAVVVVDFLLGNPIDWWMVILAFLASFLSLVTFSDVWND